jgi:glycosyltransferase involved in cell wall biosynthesis
MTMAANQTVTIGLPFYNCERTLADAIRSVFAQTEADWELLLVDDGSTDGSLAIAKQVRDARVTVVSDGVNRGLSCRLNQIARLSVRPFLARMDGDDLMHPSRLARQREFLQANPGADVVGSAAYIIGTANEVTGRRGDNRFDPSPRAVLGQGLFIHPTVTGRREWFLRHPYDPRFVRAEDRELWCRMAGQATFARVDEPLLFYREPAQVNLANYLQSCATDRRILGQYGPDIIGDFSTRILIARSRVKAVCYRAAHAAGRADVLVRRRNHSLTREEHAAATATVERMLRTPVPGFEPAGARAGVAA